jgi:CheY-like chemotaxis protein
VRVSGSCHVTINRRRTRPASDSLRGRLGTRRCCVCHLTVNFANAENAIQTACVRVVIFPWDLLAVILCALVVILLLVRMARRRYRVAHVRVVEHIVRLRPNWRLIHAGLGQLSIDLVQTHHPDLVLLDLHLPDLSGQDVLS